jgi:tRNA uridine 5-carboxymethylaminomethyl modification enzyme
VERKYQIIVVGGGHAGSEAAHAAAKLGFKTLLLTSSIDSIAAMPCNPAIGGPAKSQLVREIDAMGGIMALAADATYMQLKTLNRSKGPAVQSLRAQSDKRKYSNWVRQYLESLDNLNIFQATAKSLIVDEKGIKVLGIITNLDEKIFADAVIVTAGTFLEARVFSGDKFESAGRAAEKASLGLSPELNNLGLKVARLKTGTPARLDRRYIDFSELEVAPGDSYDSFFSFLPNRPILPQLDCHITRTNEKTHEIIRANLHRSPMYSGLVDSKGPRYCPSIEDKVVRFSHNPSHHFFLEPESASSNEIYLQGCSTSLPIDVQWQIVRSLPGLKNAEITRPAYAVEYDFFPAYQFKANLESKTISGLFMAGQVLGTSGYEEAAAQGLMAGINASRFIDNEEPFILDRSSSYIGTLIDDLVTKEITDPYRMLTSRSEYRLLLRQDNADRRLTPLGRKIRLVDDLRWSYFEKKQDRIQREIAYLNSVKITEKSKAGDKVSLAEILKRTNLNHLDLPEDLGHSELDEGQISKLKSKNIFIGKLEFPIEVETEIKYEGYIKRQLSFIEDTSKYERIIVPLGFDFKNCQQISLEAREKLDRVRPLNLAQASRVGGVSPNDISVLSILFLAKKK